MKTKISTVIALLLAFAVLCVGCSSYKPGESVNGVFTNSNAGFKISNPEGFSEYDDLEKANQYFLQYNIVNSRGALKSFVMEYGARTGASEILVYSEENINNLTVDQVADSIINYESSGFLSFNERANEDVTLGGKTFRKIETTNGGCHHDFYIVVKPDRIYTIFVFWMDDFESDNTHAVDSISLM